MELTIDDFKSRIIDDGIESCRKDNRLTPYEIEGSIEGFNLCRSLNNPEDFLDILQKRHEKENKMMMNFEDTDKEIEAYWKYRYTTLQIEFVWERMKIAWKISGPIRASAILHYVDLLRLQKEST